MSIGSRTHEEFMEEARAFHGYPAPGLIIGGYMVELAKRHMPEGVLYDAVSETAHCLPDAVQLLTPCTFGNGWLRVLPFGIYAVTLYDKATGEAEYMAVTPWGDLYPCHQFVGEEAYKLGDIWNGVTNTALREEFRSCNAYARPECNDCWARFYCSGGCAANAFHATGSIRGVYEAGCELFRKRIECAIMMKVAEDSAKANG